MLSLLADETFWEYVWRVYHTPIEGFLEDPIWKTFGFLGQAIFMSRFLLQWYVSEKKRRNVLPVTFWYLSLLGGFIVLLYSIHTGDIVFIAAFSLNTVIYVRNLIIYYERRRRHGLVFGGVDAEGDLPELEQSSQAEHAGEGNNPDG